MAKLIETFAKADYLKGKEVLIASECLERMHPEVFKKFAKGREVLTSCPEAEIPSYGKIASMLKSVPPKKIIVLTAECSPHCFTLHASVNEAFYITGSKIPKEHYVCINGEIKKISANAIRISRYLHLVEELINKNPEVLDKLKKYSLECKSLK